MVSTETGMNFSQELPPLFLGDTSLKYSGSAFLVEFSFVHLVGFRAPENAGRLILIPWEFSPIKVGQEGLGPWGNYYHNKMGRWCYFGGRAPDDVSVLGIWGCGRIWTGVAALPLPHHRWLEEPFQKDVRWDGVVLSADAGKDIRRLIVFSNHMMKFKPLESR